VRTTSFRKREVGRVHVDFEVVIANLIFVPVPADMIGNVGPRPQSIDLCSFQEQELLVGTPFSVEYWEGVLLDYSVGMGRRLMGVARFAFAEACHTEIIFIAHAVGASDPNLSGEGVVSLDMQHKGRLHTSCGD